MLKMKTADPVTKTTLKVENIDGFMIRKVTKFGTGAKIDCPKKHLGKTVYVIICKNEGGDGK